MNVKIAKIGEQITVHAPYNSLFVSWAKTYGGRWDGEAWRFDSRDVDRVRELLAVVYGDDGQTRDVVTLRVEWPSGQTAGCRPIEIGGRTIARASGRDSGAKLGEGIVILSGGFASGGSQKNWRTVARPGTVVLVREFARTRAHALVLGSNEQEDCEEARYSVEPEAVEIDREALSAERARLVQRIAQIDALLGSPAAGASEIHEA